MSLNDDGNIFHPDVPSDLSHASLIRAEALDWLDSNFPGSVTFPGVRVLAMAGEQKRRWLIGRLREHGTGGQKDFDLPATLDALTIMFLRSNGVKFRDAVDAVIGGTESLVTLDSRNGGVWNRLSVFNGASRQGF